MADGRQARAAVRAATIERDRAAYERQAEQPDAFWVEADAWAEP